MSGLYFLLTWELAELGELEKVSEFMFSSPHFIWKFDVPGRSLFFLCVCVLCGSNNIENPIIHWKDFLLQLVETNIYHVYFICGEYQSFISACVRVETYRWTKSLMGA